MYLQHLPDFLTYFGMALISVLNFFVVYILITLYNELREIRDNRNQAAAIALSGALLGYTIPIASLLIHAVNLIDFFAWSLIALLVQLLAFVASVTFSVNERIVLQDNSAATMLASISIVLGILNAACLVY